MTDIDIIRLLWIRDEIAIEELEINYGHYCRQISWEIVQNREDVSECLNDGGKHGVAFRKTDQIRFEHMSQGSQEIYRLTR